MSARPKPNITKAHRELALLMMQQAGEDRSFRIYVNERAMYKRIEQALTRMYPNLILVRLGVTR